MPPLMIAYRAAKGKGDFPVWPDDLQRERARSARKLLPATARSMNTGRHDTRRERTPAPASRCSAPSPARPKKEVAQKLKAATAAIDNGTYSSPHKQTLGQWLDAWAETYLRRRQAPHGGSVQVLYPGLYQARPGRCAAGIAEYPHDPVLL